MTARGRNTIRSGRRGSSQCSAVLLDQATQCVGQFAESIPGHCGDLEDTISACLEVGANQFGQFPGIRQVELVQSNQLRALQQRKLPLRTG